GRAVELSIMPGMPGGSLGRWYVKVTGGKTLARVVVEVQGQPDLVEVVAARRALGRFADLLDRRDQQSDQHGDDGDHDQQLDEGETAALAHATFSRLPCRGRRAAPEPQTNGRSPRWRDETPPGLLFKLPPQRLSRQGHSFPDVTGLLAQ